MTEKKIEFIEIEKIDTDENQPRKTFEDIGELAQSIIKQGLVEPIKVMKNDKRYLLIDGERRFRAYSLLAKKHKEYRKIECMVIKPKSKIIIQLITDVHKHKLPHLEEGEAYKRLLEEEKLDIEEIARMVGKNRSYVRDKLKLTAFNDITKQMIRDKKIPAQLLYSVDIDKAKKAENRIVQRIYEEKPTRGEVRRIIVEEVDRQGLVIDHFQQDCDSFIRKIDKFQYELGRLEVLKLEDSLGSSLKEVLAKVHDFNPHLQVALRIKEDMADVKKNIENLIRKYGKGTELTKALLKK